MKTTRTASIIAVGATVVLIGAGIAWAKHDHEGHGHGSHGHEHGGSLGGSSENQGNDHGHGGGGGGSSGDGPGNHGQSGGRVHGGSDACDAASSVIMAFVDATCPCAGLDDGNGGIGAWKTHGRDVRCVAHAVRDAARMAGVKRRCARGLVPCAANSSCGKKGGAVACVLTAAGTCTNGVCSDDATKACVTDADCTARTCSVTSADDCAASGGAASSGSCCTASPSGAFVD